MKNIVIVISFLIGHSALAQTGALLALGGGVIATKLNVDMAKKHAPECPHKPFSCLLVSAAVLQVSAIAVSMVSAGKTNNQLNNGGTGNFTGPTGPNNNTTPGEPPTTPDQRTIQKIKKELEDKGYALDTNKGTLTTPKGTGSASMLGSGQALADAGLLDQEDVAEYDKSLKAHNDKILKASSGIAGGGGYAPRRSTASYGDDSGYDFDGRGQGRSVEPAKTSGLSKNFGNDPVGIATDNLFDMVHRRYQNLKSKDNFIDQ